LAEWVKIGAFSGDLFEPATILISPEILRLIAELDELEGAWRVLGRY
jgi:hypothetical protein